MCRIARFPFRIRTEINVRLRDGWKLATITDWLFKQPVESEVPDLNLKPGDPCSLAWTRTTKDESAARTDCRLALGRWLRGPYLDWLKEEAEGDIRVRVVERVEKLGQAASEKAEPDSSAGGNLIIRSLLMEAIHAVCTGKNDPADIAVLANSWARMNQVGTEIEKLKLRAEDAIDIGLKALQEEMKANPRALEQFNKLREIVKRPAKPSA
jgi:hypothetical protein